MKKLILIIGILTFFTQIGYSQLRQELICIPSGDSVALILTVPPTSTEGFHLFRQGPLPGNQEYICLTSERPIKPILDAARVKEILGDDWPVMVDAFGTNEPFDILRKLRGDDFVGLVHSLFSPNVARLTGRWFLDSKVEPGASYNYRVVIVSDNGKEKAIIEKEVLIKDSFPDPPVDMTVEPGDGKVTLKWDYPAWAGDYTDLAIQYFVYRKTTESEFEKLDHTPIIRDDLSAPGYSDLWLENGIEYFYQVRAVDPLRRQSEPSATISCIPVDKSAPSLPKNVITEAGDGVVVISWDMSLELDVAGYNLYRSLGLKEDYIKIDTKPIAAEYPVAYDSSIANGVQYFYAVTAFDKSGNESKKSNPVTCLGEDRTPPEPPANLTFSLANKRLTLNWSPSNSKDLSGYYVYRGMTEDIQPKIIHDPYLDTMFVDEGYQGEGMTPGKSFWISVSAVDKSRNESEKVSMIVEIPDDVPPSPPQGFIAENESGRYVNITCSGSASLDVATYRLIREDIFSDQTIIAEIDQAPLSYRDTSVVKGREYIYYAIAIDSADNKSLPGRVDSVFVKDTSPPPSPRNCQARLTEEGISLKWERVIDFDLVGYNIYRSTIPSGVYDKVNNEILTKLIFTDGQGLPTHYYKIKSIDTSGNESTRSEAVRAN